MSIEVDRNAKDIRTPRVGESERLRERRLLFSFHHIQWMTEHDSRATLERTAPGESTICADHTMTWGHLLLVPCGDIARNHRTCAGLSAPVGV